MPEVDPEHTPIPTAVIGWDGTVWRAFAVDAAGQLQIDVLTAAGLEDALQSVATDRLIVRGEDQLFSFHDSVALTRVAKISGAGGYVDSDACQAGEVLIITNIGSIDHDNATTRHRYSLRHGGVDYRFGRNVAAIATAERVYWGGWKWMDVDDVIRVDFIGGLVNDDCEVTLTGYRMTLET